MALQTFPSADSTDLKPETAVANGQDNATYQVRTGPGRVKDLPVSLRPREDLARRGADKLADEQLLAIVLRAGSRGMNVLELSRALLRRYERLSNLAQADWQELKAQRLPGLGQVKAMELAAALEIGRRIGVEQAVDGLRLQVCEPAAVARVMTPLARGLRQEIFWVLLLDTKNRLLGRPLEITRGVLDASLVHPREVFSPAVRQCAAAMVLAHNHPSGDPSPSAEDLRITRQLVDAGKLLDIRVLDHVIIGREMEGRPGFISLREAGLATFA